MEQEKTQTQQENWVSWDKFKKMPTKKIKKSAFADISRLTRVEFASDSRRIRVGFAGERAFASRGQGRVRDGAAETGAEQRE